MPQPIYDVNFLRTLSAGLTNVAVAWMQDQDRFVASDVFPLVPVDVQAGSYPVYTKEDWFRNDVQVRAPATETAGTGWNETFDTYLAQPWGVHKDIDGMTRANALAVNRNPELTSTRLVANQLLLKRETDFVNKYMTTGVWATDRTGVASGPSSVQFIQWNDYVNSTPILDIEKFKQLFEQLTGFSPSVLVMGPQVFAQVKNHPTVLDRIKYTQRAVVTEDLLADLFEVPKLVVPRAVSVTSDEQASSTTMGYIWGKAALLAYTPETPSTEHPSAGYTFTWQGFIGAGNNQGTRVRSYRIEQLDVTRVEAESAYDMKVVAKECGLFMASAVA